MKKIIIFTTIIIVLCVVGFILFFNKNDKLESKFTNIVEKDYNSSTSDNKVNTKENDNVDKKEVINNNSEKTEEPEIKDSTPSSNEKSDNNKSNPTSSSTNNVPVVENNQSVSSQPIENNEPIIENTTPSTPTTPSCTPKKFINSWFIGEFTSQQACLDAGEKYMFDYSVSCPYLDDDCGTTYWMLQLIDRNNNIVDYHTLN